MSDPIFTLFPVNPPKKKPLREGAWLANWRLTTIIFLGTARGGTVICRHRRLNLPAVERLADEVSRGKADGRARRNVPKIMHVSVNATVADQ